MIRTIRRCRDEARVPLLVDTLTFRMTAAEPRSYDHVIVGAGSAGSVLAERLGANPDARVLVLEAGGSDASFWIHLPVGYFRSIYDTRVSRLFRTEPEEGTAGRRIDWPRGRVVGGSSSINGLVFIRGQQEDFNDWAKAGAEGWGWSDVLPHFRRIERYGGEPSQLRGGDGALGVSDLRNDHPLCDAWVRAGTEAGLPTNADFNGESTLGVGAYQLSLEGRWRASAAKAFLRPALGRGNVDLVTHASAEELLFDAERCIGVRWRRHGEVRETYAEAGVILSAGAIQSPQLLQLSGIGPADSLRALGIPVRADLPGVGGNLQDHYQMRTIVELAARESFNDEVRNPLKLVRMGLRWLVDGSGPLSVGAGQVGGAACTSLAEDGRPDVQFNVMPLSVDKPGKPLHRYSGFTAAVWQCHPRSRGRVDVVSRDPAADPRIVPNYLSDPHDRQTMIEGVRLLRDIYRQPAFRDRWTREVVPGAEHESDAELLDAIRRMGGTVYHCVGTCRMGAADDPDAVVDPSLRVRGINGLHVIDASVMPTIVSANTNAATLMIADRGAELLNGSTSLHPPLARASSIGAAATPS